MRTKLAALVVAFALFASLGLVGGAVTPVDNSEPELVAVGDDVESAHNTNYCKKRNKTTTVWSITYINTRREKGQTVRYYLHRPRGAWNLIYGAHVERNVC